MRNPRKRTEHRRWFTSPTTESFLPTPLSYQREEGEKKKKLGAGKNKSILHK